MAAAPMPRNAPKTVLLILLNWPFSIGLTVQPYSHAAGKPKICTVATNSEFLGQTCLTKAELFDAMLDNEETLAFVKNERCEFVYMNNAFRELHRLGKGEAVGKNAFQVLASDSAQRIDDIDRKVIETGETTRHAMAITFKDGRERHFSICKQRHVGGDGHPYLVGVALDVTEQVLAEQKAREHAIFLENALEGVAKIDANGIYTYCNPAYGEMHDQNPQQMIGTLRIETIHPDDRQAIDSLTDQVVNAGSAKARCLGLRADGSTFYKEVLQLAIIENDEFKGCYCFAKDVTQQQEDAEALDNYRRRVEQLLLQLELGKAA